MYCTAHVTILECNEVKALIIVSETSIVLSIKWHENFFGPSQCDKYCKRKKL